MGAGVVTTRPVRDDPPWSARQARRALMARIPGPWYAADKRPQRAHDNACRATLLTANNDKTTANAKAAVTKLRQILKGSASDAAPASLRVADVIDRYLKLSQPKYSERAFEERVRYLQLFAESHGWRRVNDRDCLPIHIEEWVAAHPEWSSDWTKAHIVSIVMRPFNWATKKRIIGCNPFRGAEQAAGEPRRPLTDEEFQLLLRNATVRRKRMRPRKLYPSDIKKRQHPSSGARFRQVLICLRFTGMRPGELARLEWDDIDLANQV